MSTRFIVRYEHYNGHLEEAVFFSEKDARDFILTLTYGPRSLSLSKETTEYLA